MFAYVIIHFGSNIKYLEYEMYEIIMLQSISKYDIVYMYSIHDTPEIFVKTIKKMGVKTKGFDDSLIIDRSKKFSSIYPHFNVLRVCCFIYANLLVEYEKVCVIESDIILYKGIDNVFKLQTPSVYFYDIDRKNSLKNYKIVNIDKKTNVCDFSLINGGVMLFEPNKKLIKNLDTYIDSIITHNCKFPNETLFLLLYNDIYNLPINYNIRKYIDFKEIKIYGRHFDFTQYKPLDIIKDNYVDKVKTQIVKESLKYFKTNYYDKYHTEIDKIIDKIIHDNNN
jgi:hypothetical protein